jgi:hypothetical protein
MSLARVKKASSTLMLALAEVSMNLIPYSMASCSPRSFDTWRDQKFHLLQASRSFLLFYSIMLKDIVFTQKAVKSLHLIFLLADECWKLLTGVLWIQICIRIEQKDTLRIRIRIRIKVIS